MTTPVAGQTSLVQKELEVYNYTGLYNLSLPPHVSVQLHWKMLGAVSTVLGCSCFLRYICCAEWGSIAKSPASLFAVCDGHGGGKKKSFKGFSGMSIRWFLEVLKFYWPERGFDLQWVSYLLTVLHLNTMDGMQLQALAYLSPTLVIHAPAHLLHYSAC